VKGLATAATCIVLLPVLVISAALGGTQGESIQTDAATSTASVASIPVDYLVLYQQAAAAYNIPWELLAAIGTVESENGQNPNIDQPNSAGAEGPMQFLPATFAEYASAAGDPDPSILNPRDAIYAAAAMLAANGAPTNTSQAAYAYNHAQWYVDEVLALEASYTAQAAGAAGAGASALAAEAVAYAEAQIGTPYEWGAEDPGVAFDCSGLTQAAYGAAGIQLPRTAQDQYDAGPLVQQGEPLEPGDLVFFGTSPTAVDHVGIVASPAAGTTGEMIDAPYTGAEVREEPFPTTSGAVFGDLTYLGATQPSSAPSSR
jgi:cell wall-associated NlpC family hydrolase